MTWHLLQVSDSLDEELGSALSELVPLLAWEPKRTTLPMFGQLDAGVGRTTPGLRLRVHPFPLVRGYARLPWKLLIPTGRQVVAHLLRKTNAPDRSPLICTTPYLAPVAERWPGPVIYWLTDLIAKYENVNESAIHDLDTRMCDVATLVFPNSLRLASYLIEKANCAPEKIRILPNATRQCNVFPHPPTTPSPLPPDVNELPRPVAGVIGNLSGNMDWLFLEELINRTPAFHWCFVGPTTMPVRDAGHRAARARVMDNPRARFVGKKLYGELASYARSFDIAVLPYRRCEPTFSGSSTRFYEHLAACRPMISTKGFEELLRKEPLLRLADTPLQASELMEQLKAENFDDGFAELRWMESRQGTWQARAATMTREVSTKLGYFT